MIRLTHPMISQTLYRKDILFHRDNLILSRPNYSSNNNNLKNKKYRKTILKTNPRENQLYNYYKGTRMMILMKWN